MIYVYCALISWATFITSLVAVFLLVRWAIPRYGARAMRMAMSGGKPTPPPGTPPVI